MLKLGLTGSIGAGKSSVATILKTFGIVVLDADLVARQVSAGPEVLNEVTKIFGPEFVTGHYLNRQKLAALVFADPSARQKLNNIIHPRVRQTMQHLQSEEEALGAKVVVQDIPLLFENNLQTLFDATILVDAPLEQRVQRVMQRDGLTREQVLARDAAQMPASKKRQLASFVLENDGDLQYLEEQVQTVLQGFGLLN